MVISSLANKNFLKITNLVNVVQQQSVFVIIALGAMMIIICGALDLSSGAVIACAGCISLGVFKQLTSIPLLISLPLAILVAIAVAMFANMLSGFMVTQFKVPAFIATLAVMTIARGGALLFTKGQNIYAIGEYTLVGQGNLLGIPITIIIMVFISVMMYLIMRYTRFGRSTYAVGGNIEAARASGIKVKNIQMRAYLLNGVLVGIASVIYMSRVNSGVPNGAQGYEFDALTATIIGGTSFSGGVGSVAGTIVGAFLIGFMNNIMNILSIDSYVQQMMRGVIIAGAVIWDIYTTTKSSSKSSRV
jgi:inositol transport system permease protein